MNGLSEKLLIFFRRAASVIYPPRCPLCGRVTGFFEDGRLCRDCAESFESDFISVCPSCGRPHGKCGCVPDVIGNDWDRSPYTKILPLVFSGYYVGYDANSPVSILIYRMKRQKSSGAGVFFARISAEDVMRFLILSHIDAKEVYVTYIPRSDTAMREYGFDHMERAARRAAEMIGGKFLRVFVRSGGVSQKELDGSERKANAYNTISLDSAREELVRGAKIVVLDDVVTTGATMRAAVSRLSLAGADTVIPAAILISITKRKRDNRGSY